MPTPTELIHLCLTLPDVPDPIRELAATLQVAARPGRPVSYTPEQAAAVLRLKSDRYSVKEIAARTGVSPKTIYRILDGMSRM